MVYSLQIAADLHAYEINTGKTLLRATNYELRITSYSITLLRYILQDYAKYFSQQLK